MASETEAQVVALLNEAQLSADKDAKIEALTKVKELLVNKEPALLPRLFDGLLQFQHDRSADVQRLVIDFIEDACKRFPLLFVRTTATLGMLLSSEGQATVLKRAALCLTNIFGPSFIAVCVGASGPDGPLLREGWEAMLQLKQRAVDLMRSTNDGVRTQAIKFVEAVVLTYTPRTPESEQLLVGTGEEACVDRVPGGHPWLRPAELVAEARDLFEALVSRLQSADVTAANAIVLVTSVAQIARQRPAFIDRAIACLMPLRNTEKLPASYTNAQVASVHKALKLQLLGLLKHPASTAFQDALAAALVGLGARRAEFERFMRTNKRSAPSDSPVDFDSIAPLPKRARVETPTQFVGDGAVAVPHPSYVAPAAPQPPPGIALATAIAAALSSGAMPTPTPPQVVELLVSVLPYLPDALFAAAGVAPPVAQSAPEFMPPQQAVPPPAQPARRRDPRLRDPRLRGEDSAAPAAGAVDGPEAASETPTRMEIDAPAEAPVARPKLHKFVLAPVELTGAQRHAMAMSALRRVLATEEDVLGRAVAAVRTQAVARFVGLQSLITGEGHDEDATALLLSHVLEQPATRHELAIAWLHWEHVRCVECMNGAAKCPTGEPKYAVGGLAVYDDPTYARGMQRYGECLERLLGGLREVLGPKDRQFTRACVDVPELTPGAIEIVREMCLDKAYSQLGVASLRDIALERPPARAVCVSALLELSTDANKDLRDAAIAVITKKLFTHPAMAAQIEAYGVTSLESLMELDAEAVAAAAPVPPPPEEIKTESGQVPEDGETADLPPEQPAEPQEAGDGALDAAIAPKLQLFFALAGIKPALLRRAVDVFSQVPPPLKRALLRYIATAVQVLDIEAPATHAIFAAMPEGAEPFLLRLLNVATEIAPPSRALVGVMRGVYAAREQDARFLIPVLRAMDRGDVLLALPRVLALPPNVLREAFNRLLEPPHGGAVPPATLSPAELLVALHMLDASRDKIGWPAIIEGTNQCFGHRDVFTQEVLASALQQLVDVSPIPFLFMRTVMRALDICPPLSAFVMAILTRLISKQVWTQPKLWEGFVKCCEKTKPMSFGVLLQLPGRQLESALTIAPDLKAALVAHVQSLPPDRLGAVSRPALAALGVHVGHGPRSELVDEVA